MKLGVVVFFPKKKLLIIELHDIRFAKSKNKTIIRKNWNGIIMISKQL